MLARYAVPLLALAACDTDTVEVSLRDLQAQMYLLPSTGPATANRALVLTADQDANGDCPVLPDGTTFKLDGVASRDVTLGGAEAPHGEVHCLGMSGLWPQPGNEVGASTFEVDDGDTTWTFVIEQPFSFRSFRVTSPVGRTVHAGEAVTVALEPASGTLANARVSGFSGTPASIDAANGLTIVGHELHFTVPAVTATTTNLSVAADLALAVQRCDAPLGCQVTGPIYQMPAITIAP